MTNNTIEKAPGACDTEGFHTDTNYIDSATCECKSKAISTIRAQLALHGHELTVMQCNDFLLHTCSKPRYFKDLDTLQAFAPRLGVSK